MSDKTETIQRHLEEGKRYYPTNEKNGLDEWGALQAHRAEITRALEEQKKIEEHNSKQALSNELSNEIEQK